MDFSLWLFYRENFKQQSNGLRFILGFSKGPSPRFPTPSAEYWLVGGHGQGSLYRKMLGVDSASLNVVNPSVGCNVPVISR